MVINNGAWDYYVFFKILGDSKLYKSLKKDTFHNKCLAKYDNNKRIAVPSCKKILETNFILRDYYNRLIPAFQKTCNSLLDYHYYLNDNVQFFMMNPLRINNSDGKVTICPVTMYLLNNGFGVVKTRLPLENIDSHLVSTPNLEKWYHSAEMCTHSVEVIKTESEYGYVSDIQILIYEMIKACFPGILQTVERFPCFENYIIGNSSNPDMSAKNLKLKDLKEIYDLCYPYKAFDNKTKEDLYLISKNKIEAEGISFLKCIPGRMITFCSYKTQDCKDNSNCIILEKIQSTYDMAICIAIWQRCNELIFYEDSNNDIHKIRKNNSVYLKNENEFLRLIDNPFPWLEEVHSFVKENFTGNFKDRTEKLMTIQQLALDEYHERTAVVFNVIAFIISILFALPSIQATGQMVRNSLWDTNTEISTRVSVDNIAFCIWVVLIVAVSISLIISFKRYYKYLQQ